MLIGLNHLTLSTLDIEQSFNFYQNILACKPLAKWKRGAYLLAGDLWLCLSLDLSVDRKLISQEYTHYAFSIEPKQFEYYRQNIEKLKLRLWKNNTSEGDSLYILDPDNHKLELHIGNWQTRIKAIKKDPYEGIVFFDQT